VARYASVMTVGYRELQKLSRAARATGHTLDKISRHARYWVGEEGGHALNRTAANSLADYLRQYIWGQSFAFQVPALSDYWEYKKNRPEYWDGVTLRPHIGIATETMVNSIRALDMGGGRFAVGIPDNLYVTGLQIGTITNIATYAKILEFGSARYNVLQPPRPIFAMGFQSWVNDKSVDVAAPVVNGLNTILRELANHWEYPARDIDGNPFTFSREDDDTMSAEEAFFAREEARMMEEADDIPDIDYSGTVRPLAAPKPKHLPGAMRDRVPGIVEENQEVINQLVQGDEKIIKRVRRFWNAEDQRWQTLKQMSRRMTGVSGIRMGLGTG